MKLYELTNEMLQIQELVELGELTTEQVSDHLEMTESSIEEKAKNIAYFLENLDSDIEQISNMIKKLQDRKKRIENNNLKLRDYLTTNMERLEITKINSADISISYIKPRDVLVLDCDPMSLPPEFQRVKIEADKKALSDAMKDGQLIEGVRLEKGKASVRIKV